MNNLLIVNIFAFWLSFIMIAILFLFYPFILCVWSLIQQFFKQQTIELPSQNYKISFIIVVHNAESLIKEKIENILSLEYGKNNYEIIVYLDGCTDNTLAIIESLKLDNLVYINETLHLGKHHGLNQAVAKSQGEILIFSDADAFLEKNTVLALLKPFSNPNCGGVCGQRVIAEKQGQLKSAQKIYIRIDSLLKQLESKNGSISSNDGKLYAIRHHLFQAVAEAVTDDLYQNLCIVEQGHRFVFEPLAQAMIKIPSRNSTHELSRRRRIVARSLYGLFLKKHLFNPLQYGIFSISLLINKILRRLLGLFLILLFVSSAIATQEYSFINVFFYLQLLCYSLAISYPIVFSDSQKFKIIRRCSSVAWYFCVGNFATLLGVIDFLQGKRVIKWQPQKN
ncbi:MAG: hypothetical protein RIQ94_109 [Pseudomonadota bacterium]|jgi:cellulose synthase/poly-beta-1,6-N-acetylglucosamine synthase-like glycosyltransferase